MIRDSDDAALVRRAVAGDADAFRELFTRHGLTVVRWAVRIVQVREDARDVAQEVFLRVFRSLPEYRGESKFTVWLYRITYNLSLDWRERHARRRESTDEAIADQPDDTPNAEDLRLRSAQADVLHAAIRRLPDRDRIILNLFYWRECSYLEIARILNLPLNTVRTHLRRAKARLQQVLLLE